MPAKKSTKKTTKKVPASLIASDNKISAAAAVIFGGICVGAVGYLQGNNLQLLLIGFGCGLVFIGAVLLGMAINNK